MLDALADFVVRIGFGADPDAGAAAALHFFVYETVKIGLLLLVVTHVMGAVNAFFPVERVRTLIASGRLRGFEHLAAAGFGAVTPFCSCSSIPLFIGFLQGRIPLGVTFSFLITSPLVNEVALALFMGMFGWKVTVAYAVSGILLGTVLGWGLGRLGLERQVEDWVWAIAAKEGVGQVVGPGGRLREISRDSMAIVRKVAPYVVAGIAVGAAIHGWVPTGYFEDLLAESNPLGVPLSVLIAVPMYASASAVIPVIGSLVTKGVPLGTAIAFMMAVVGLSLPEALILRRVMRPRLLGVFFGSVALSIVGVGYLFNLLF